MVFRILFTIVIFFNLNIDQIEVKIVFLYSFLDQLMYIKIPKSIESKNNQNIICKLLKALYGLKQSL